MVTSEIVGGDYDPGEPVNAVPVDNDEDDPGQ